MRQAGLLPEERDAHRFAAWLVTQRIEAHAEQEQQGWAVWIREEDQLAKAREALEHFRANPRDARYQNAERSAEQIQREAEEQRKRAKGNVVEMRGRWTAGPGGVPRRCPLVLALIGVSILVTLLVPKPDSRAGVRSSSANLYRNLLFTDPRILPVGGEAPNVWASVLQGQVWRLVTPIFIHFGPVHLIFNALMLYSLGGQIEDRRGTRFTALLVLILAITSNLGQAFEISLTSPYGQFGGLSGVVYGVFGYLLIRVRAGNREGYALSQLTVIILLTSFFLCIARSLPGTEELLSFMPAIANSAHVVGLFVGMALAWIPTGTRAGEN
jgi:GlpG protein